MSVYREWPENELCRYLARQDWPTPRRALDLGCGNGRNGWLLTEHGFFVAGVERDAAAIRALGALCEDRGFDYVWVSDMTLPDLSAVASDVFDLVVDCQCVQHLSWADHGPMYQEIARVLKPGGRAWSMHWLSGDQPEIFPAHPELTTYTVPDIETLYHHAGLTLVHQDQLAKTYHDLHYAAIWALLEAVKA